MIRLLFVLSVMFVPAVHAQRLVTPGVDFHERKVGAVSLRLVTFSPKTHAFAVMDDPDNAFDLASAARKRAAIAAVNGGYFHPDRTPLGLVIRQGQELHALEKARLLSGLVVINDGRPLLLRTREYRASRNITEALQAGPFLVDGGKAVAGLNAKKRDARTFLVALADGRFGLGTAESPTLADLGQALAGPEAFPSAKITRALNLDGGSSTGLWIATEPPIYRRELRNVRNFVAVVPR
jgi:exopolysaccharide biosynthesis protein